jgi:DNA polymerase-3 subunit delta'
MQFRDVIGQPEAVSLIRDTIRQGRLAHSLLLTGPAGTGKLPLALAAVQYLNCLSPTEEDSCGRCSNCLKIKKLIHPDLRFVLPIISRTEGSRRFLTADYLDAFREQWLANPYLSLAQWQHSQGGEGKQLFISVHEIREIKRSVYLKAFEAPYKAVIVWNVDKINVEGANAFLKLLEEPPDRTLILMTSSDPGALLPTILSRCQRIHLRRIPREMIADYLSKQGELSREGSEEVAAIAQGSLGNAFDELAEEARAAGAQYMEWLRAVYSGNYQKISEAVEKLSAESREAQKSFLTAGLRKLRDSLLYHQSLPQLALAAPGEREFHSKFSQFLTLEKVEAMSLELEECLRQIGGNANPQMVFTALSLRLYSILRS